jgi:hypothetical protein
MHSSDYLKPNILRLLPNESKINTKFEIIMCNNFLNN